MEKAIARRDAGDVDGARRIVAEGVTALKTYARDQQGADALRLLEETLHGLGDDVAYTRSRKGPPDAGHPAHEQLGALGRGGYCTFVRQTTANTTV